MEEKEIYFNYLRKIHAISHLDMQVFKPDGVRLLRLTTQTEGGLLRDQRRAAVIQFREHIFSAFQEKEAQLQEQPILAQGDPYSFCAILYGYNKRNYLLFLGLFFLLPGSVPPEEGDLPAYTYEEISEFVPLFSQSIILSAMLESRKMIPPPKLMKEQPGFAYNNAESMLRNRNFEVSLLNTIRTGDMTGLAILLNKMDYRDVSHYSPADELRNFKNLTLAMNTLACRAAEDSKTPIDVFVRSMCAIYAAKIEAAKSKKELDQLRKELVFAYCRKVSQSTVSGYSAMVRSVVSYLDARLSEKVTLSEVATFCGVSEAHLSRTLKKECQVGFQELLNRQRIRRAKLFLLAGMSPSEAAEQSGFKTLSHFCWVFKESTGMTTTKWLQNQ